MAVQSLPLTSVTPDRPEPLVLARLDDFTVGDALIRPGRACVEAHGRVHHVEPKVMEVLVTLARAEGATLSRDELVERCWGGRVVSEDAVTRILGKVRQLAKAIDPPAFRIETLNKVGVRLVTQDECERPIIAVLPFDNLAADPALDYFSDGIAEEILDRIVRGSSLKVIGRVSSFQFRGAAKAGAAARLKATHVVDGSVRKAGSRVRINVHLAEAGSGATLWSDRFDRELDDVFSMQDEIAERIAGALDMTFDVARKSPIDAAVYDLYLRAKAVAANPETVQANIMVMEAVTAAAPTFADGWARLATLRAWHAMRSPYEHRAAIAARARAENARARALDPSHPDIGHTEFWLAAPFGDFRAQEEALAHVLATNPRSSDAQCIAAFHALNIGCGRAALAHAEQALALDPQAWNVSVCHVMCLWAVGACAEAEAACEAHLSSWPEDSQVRALLVLAYARRGAWTELDAMTAPSTLAHAPLKEFHAILAVAGVMRSPTPENRALLLSVLSGRVDRSGAIDPSVMFWAADLGLRDEIYDLSGKARFGPAGRRSDVIGLMAYRTLTLFMAAFPSVRQDPRFATICARLGLVRYWLESGRWPDCADHLGYDFRAACAAACELPVDPFPFVS